MSLIDDFGSLYLASRLERLSELLKKDAVHVFKQHLHGIKYKWYPVVYTLHVKGSVSVMELANELSYAHPTIIDILTEMQAEGIVKSSMDKTDNRKRNLSLTAKGNKILKEILPLTEAFTAVVNDLIDNKHHLLKALLEVEEELQEESFYKKVNKLLSHKQHNKKNSSRVKRVS
jgi:DNA-binding MarR family transcriptional regulator